MGCINIKSVYNSIFRSAWDALIYLFLYIIVPLWQAITYIINLDKSRFVCIIILLSSILYDCYTRFNDDMSKNERKMIFCIGSISFILIILSLSFHLCILNNIYIHSWVYILYIPFLLPFVVCVWELCNHIRRVMAI